MSKTFKIVGNISAILGILGFVYTIYTLNGVNLNWFQIIFMSISLLICIIYLIIEIFSGPQKYKSDEAINKYMRNWIKKSGRTVVFTRDMSWVNNDEIEEDLRQKARKKELIICQPSRTELTDSLEELGAELYTYANLNFTPRSRFTFINYDTNSSRVAIGKKDNSHHHVITEYTSNDTIEYYLAEDLVNLIKSLN